MSDTKTEFYKEFRALLEKYNVGIEFHCGEGSDTHGIYDEKIIVYHTKPGTFHNENWIVVNGWGIDKNDL